jgi:hypothetical protein
VRGGANTAVGIPVDNDFFDGRALVLLRPLPPNQPPDPYT